MRIPPGRPHSAARRGFARYEWAIAAALGVACSVFPDRAVLPGGSGGSSGGGSYGTSGNNGTSGSGMGGNAGAGLGGERTGGGADAGGAGSSGAPDAGGAAAGSGAGGNAGAGAGGSSPETGGTGGVTTSSGGQGGGAGCATPTVLRFDATADTYLNEAKNQQGKNYGSETSLLISGVTDARARTLVNFDLSTLPTGRNIRSATLRFVLVTPIAGTRTLSVYRVGRAWQEDKATWARATTAPAVNWTLPGGDTALLPSSTLTSSDAALGAHVDLDVRADVAALIPADPYYGWLLDAAPSDNVVEFASRQSLFPEDRPALVVELCP